MRALIPKISKKAQFSLQDPILAQFLSWSQIDHACRYHDYLIYRSNWTPLCNNALNDLTYFLDEGVMDLLSVTS